jgi:hypothetical protein
VVGAVLAATTVSGSATTTALGVEGPTAWPGAKASAAGERWVTLVTGDRVLVRPGPRTDELVRVDPGTGRDKITFRSYHDESGALVVVPVDAEGPLNAGTLDQRLFDVSGLIQDGYDDRSRQDVPLIVTRTAPSDAATRTLLGGTGIRVTRDLPSVRGDAVSTAKPSTGLLWQKIRGNRAQRNLTAGVARVMLDGAVRATLDASVPQIGAPAAWQAGHTGAGATVAVLDSGIDATHPDLADAVAQARDFTGSDSGTVDKFGHGTHVASIITGSGAASDATFVGVAPDARLLIGKVLNDVGSGAESGVIAGMEWAVSQGADVVNLSLSSQKPSDGNTPLDLAVNELTAQSGTLFVVSAGNTGPRVPSVGSPGAADAALTVGAVSKQDELADFSSRGPRLGDAAIKPDITAPGVDIVAARAAGSGLGTPVSESYQRLSGTSMAAPHVAGAAAILAGQYPDLKADDLKALLMGTAIPRGGVSLDEQGAGRVDVARASRSGVYAVPASLGLGVALWPHEDDTPIEKTVTYHNTSDASLTLDLSFDVRDASGALAPAGMFTVDTPRITVPAHGMTAVAVRANTAVPAPDARYTGVLVAIDADGNTVARNPLTVRRDVERHDITVSFVDANGAPTPEYSYRFVDVVNQTGYRPYDASGTVVVNLPVGEYFLDAHIRTLTTDGEVRSQTEVAEPAFTVSKDATLILDARDGKPFGTTVDRASARVYSAGLGFVRTTRWGQTGSTTFGNTLDNVLVRPSQTTAAAGQFTFHVQKELAKPDGSGGFANSPYLYHTHWQADGRVPTVLVRHLGDAGLAVVHATFVATAPNRTVTKANEDSLAIPVPFSAPARVTEYYSTDVPWTSQFAQESADPELPAIVQKQKKAFSAGQPASTERWNAAVFGPAFPAWPSNYAPWVWRWQNRMSVDIPIFTDQAADHWGYVTPDEVGSSLVLYRDGVKYAETGYPGGDFYVLPDDEATYRLESNLSQSVSTTSTHITAAWTFRSGYVDSVLVQSVPMMAVRFAPVLDNENRAPAGRPFNVPVYVQQQAGAEYGTLTGLTVQASFDDGATWRPVTLTGTGLSRTAHLTHPAGAGFVSLKASATDSHGNAVEETIIRAYAIC